jgi:hypothetical protein
MLFLCLGFKSSLRVIELGTAVVEWGSGDAKVKAHQILESKENRWSPFVRSAVPFDSNPHEYGRRLRRLNDRRITEVA